MNKIILSTLLLVATRAHAATEAPLPNAVHPAPRAYTAHISAGVVTAAAIMAAIALQRLLTRDTQEESKP